MGWSIHLQMVRRILKTNSSLLRCTTQEQPLLFCGYLLIYCEKA
jgi:hypothetical protein